MKILNLRYIARRDLIKFLLYKRGWGWGEASFEVKGIPHKLLCRAGTTDAIALDYVFGPQSHLPPKPLPHDAVILDLGANVG